MLQRSFGHTSRFKSSFDRYKLAIWSGIGEQTGHGNITLLVAQTDYCRNL